VANGSAVSWQHINLLGEYDFSDESTCFGDDLVLGIEVPIEAAVSEARGSHQIGKTRPGDSILPEGRRCRLDDSPPSYRSFLFGFPHAVFRPFESHIWA
jgi:hypothetical protein